MSIVAQLARTGDRSVAIGGVRGIGDRDRLLGVWKQGLLLLLVVSLAGCRQAGAQPGVASEASYPGERWATASSPEDLGWSAEKLARAEAYSKRIGSAAVMIVDDGVVVDAWGDLDRTYLCHSMRKSLLSALIGIHVGEGDIDLSRTMEELEIDDTEPSLTAAEKQATVGDLIMARSGIYHPALGEAASMKEQRPERHSHAPGTFWYYNNWDFNALGTIFEQETGTRIFEDFNRRIAEPLQMEDFSVGDCGYATAVDEGVPGLSVHNYYSFRLSARDLARFGLLFLREGRWKGEQIVPADWVRESTATHSATGSGGGYGYMWWTGEGTGLLPNVEVQGHSFRASGYRGHEVIVLPSRNLVVVHRVNTDLAEPDVSQAEIGALLWLILDAAGETGIGEAPCVEGAPGDLLGGDDLHVALAGRTLQIQDPEDVMVHYGEDGELGLWVSGSLSETGTWWTEGDLYCHKLSPAQGGVWCGQVVLEGDTLGFFDSRGLLYHRLEYKQAHQ